MDVLKEDTELLHAWHDLPFSSFSYLFLSCRTMRRALGAIAFSSVMVEKVWWGNSLTCLLFYLAFTGFFSVVNRTVFCLDLWYLFSSWVSS